MTSHVSWRDTLDVRYKKDQDRPTFNALRAARIRCVELFVSSKFFFLVFDSSARRSAARDRENIFASLDH
jgi:hypothetical protein